MVYERKAARRIRMGIFLLLLLCMTGCCTVSAGAANATNASETQVSSSVKTKKKAALNETSVKMTKGKTYQLRLRYATGTVTWKSNKRSVATVSKNGKVLGVSKGTCKITAKYKGKTYRCTVKVYNNARQYMPTVLKQKYTVSKNQDKIVLAGSSSMQYWDSAASAFSPWKILNMGVATTKVSHWQKLYTSLIVKYNPKAVVLYVGANDIGDGSYTTGADTAAQTRRLIQKIRKKLPDTKIFYVSICPNPQRYDAWNRICACNKRMKSYCESQEDTYYIDVASYFWNGGKLNTRLYRDDKLHLSKAGYKIWNKVIGTKVKKVLKTVE